MVMFSQADHPQQEASTLGKTSLLDEIAVLRKRIRDYEERDDSGSRGSNGSTIPTAEDTIGSLRKELAEVTNSKAEMELEYMNMMSSLEQDKQTQIEAMQTKLEESEKSKLVLSERVTEAEETAGALSDELNLQREQMEKEISLQQIEISNLEEEVYTRDNIIEEQRTELLDLRSDLNALKSSHEILQDEYDDTAQRLDESTQLVAELKTQITTLSAVGSPKAEKTKELDIKISSLETRAADAERNAVALTKELEHQREEMEMEIASKETDIVTIERELYARDAMLEDQKLIVESLETTLNEKASHLEKVTEEQQKMKEALTEAEKESSELKMKLVDLTSQRISYEKRTTMNIMDQVAEVDTLRAENEKMKTKLEEKDTYIYKLREQQDCRDIDSANTSCSPVRAAISKYERLGCVTRKAAPIKDSTSVVDQLTAEVSSLKEQLHYESEQVALLNAEIAELSRCSETPNNVSDHDESCTTEIEELQEKIRMLENHLNESHPNHDVVEDLQEKIKILEDHLDNECKHTEHLREEIERLTQLLEEERKQIDMLNEENMELTQQRMQHEQRSKEALEQRDAHNKSLFDKQLESVRLEVKEMQRRNAEIEEGYQEQIEIMAKEKIKMEMEVEEEWGDMQNEIDELLALLEEKDKELSCMKKELQPLRASLVEVDSARTKVDELLSELTEKIAENASQAEQIDMLRTEAATQQEEVVLLQAKIQKLAAHSVKAQRCEKSLKEMTEENRALKERVEALTIERQKAQGKLKDAKARDGPSNDALREKNATLKKEVERLTRRLKHLESSITRISI